MGSKALVAIVTVVGAVVLFVVLRGSEDDSETAVVSTTTQQESTQASDPPGGGGEPSDKPKPEPEPEPEPAATEIVVEQGQPVGGVAELTVEKGDSIRLLIKSDVTDELHLHGYDVSKPIEAGGQVEYDVPATIEGVFELELENTAVPLAEISVVPG